MSTARCPADRIEGDAQGEHAREDFEWRDDMGDAILHGPVGEARRIDAGADGDGAILVPANRPVPRRRFVEQDRADRAGGGAEDRSRDGSGWLNQAGEAGDRLQARAGTIRGNGAKSIFESRDLIWRERSRVEPRAIGIEPHGRA